uniref:non-specific serine/threonine protein kinase n=1 Tax=Mesocestoides corti TaxID=53468 RepID=A0A5K3F786_MESCO
MGNQVFGMTSSQVVGSEECLRELQSWLTFEEELSGSRLFKVAKARCLVGKRPSRKIVKIFAYTKATFSIETIRQTVMPFSRRIDGAVNLLPLNTNYITDRYAFIIRDFVDQSLTERLCTRPFLSHDEKRWIAFQLLSAVDQLHSSSSSTNNSQPLCHGDIKSENVLLTAWGWLFLADPAPFKPVQLPADNPSEFTYFFDSSRRRACYLAPERFTDPVQAGGIGCEGFGSAPGFLHLGGDDEQADWAPEEEEHVSFGEIADETLKAEDDDEGEVGVFVPTPTASIAERRQTGKSEDLDLPLGRLRLVVSGSCLRSTTASSSSSSPLLEAIGDSPEGEIEASRSERHLRPSMDLFSVGCVLLEMFTDGLVAFTLSDLLSYRRHQNCRLMKLLSSVADPAARALITDLVSLHPEGRGTAAHHLSAQRGGLFPEFFFTTLQPFMQCFLDPCMACADARLRCIRANLPGLLSRLLTEPPEAKSAASIVLCNLITSSLRHNAAPAPNTSDCPATALPFSQPSKAAVGGALTIPARAPSEGAKVDAILCLLLLAERLPSLRLFDRLWPHFVELTDSRHHSSEVRRLALEALVQTLDRVTSMLSSKAASPPPVAESETTYVSVVHDIRFINEFLLPCLAPLAADHDVEVRIAMAQCLPRFADICSGLLEFARLRLMKEEAEGDDASVDQVFPLPDVGTALRLVGKSVPTRGIDAALKNAKAQLKDRLVTLFSDTDNCVRRALMEINVLAKLATFFGPSQSNDIILSHMITFLNDKNDPNLRSAFFNQIGPLTGIFGAQSVTVLRPLLEQGLSDPNETVLDACLRALGHLQRRGLLSGPASIAFLRRALALTAHPSAHIRQACIAYVTAFARVCTDASSNPTFGPLDDRSIETASSLHNPLASSVSDLAKFAAGKCGLASLYAHLATDEVNKRIFARPVGFSFTNDAVLLFSLHPPLRHAVLEGVATACFDVTAACHSDGTSAHTVAAARELCEAFVEHLKERQVVRSVTRADETPWYPVPANDLVTEVLNHPRLRELTARAEDQLLQLSPLLISLCQNVRDPSEVLFAGGSARTPNHPRLLLSVVAAAAASDGGASDTDSPTLRARWRPLCAHDGVRMRRLQPFNSPGSLPEEPTLQEAETKSSDRDTSRFALAPMKQELSFVEILSQRMNEGRFPLPTVPPPDVVFARGLTIATPPDAAENGVDGGYVNLRVSTGSTHHHHHHASSSITPPLLREHTDIPAWALGHTNRITLVAHLHEHVAGHLSLASHPSKQLLASCSSGDGQVKFWDCGRGTQANSGHNNNNARDAESTDDSDDGDREEEEEVEDVSMSAALGGQFLPSRSLSTYSVSQQHDSADGKPSCRYLVWTDAGSSVATLANRSAIHLVDDSVSCLRCLIPVQTAHHGLATYLAGPATAFCGGVPTPSYALSGTDQNLIVYSTTNDNIVGQDVRAKQPVWVVKQNREHGLIRCLVVHSGHTWLAAGTSHGHVVNWDLRYQREISHFQLPYGNCVSITGLKLYESQRNSSTSTLILVATDHHNEVAIFDLEASNARSPTTTRVASTWAQSTSRPLVLDNRSLPFRSVHSLLVFPPVAANSLTVGRHAKFSSSSVQLPSIVAGGSDARLRCWTMSRPDASSVLAWAGREEACQPLVSFKEKLIDGVRVAVEVENQPQAATSAVGPPAPFGNPSLSRGSRGRDRSSWLNPTPVCPLEMGEVTRGHTNAISDLAMVLHAGRPFLASAAMNGVIKFWK